MNEGVVESFDDLYRSRKTDMISIKYAKKMNLVYAARLTCLEITIQMHFTVSSHHGNSSSFLIKDKTCVNLDL